MRQLLILMTCAAGLAACAQEVSRMTTAPGVQAPAPLIPRDAVFGNPERTQGRISPDGAWVSWLAPLDGVMNVWVAPARDPGDARAITKDDYRGIRQHLWAANSETVLYLQDTGGDENNHVFAADVASGEVRDLTPVKEGVRAVLEGVSRRRPDTVLVGLNDRDPQLFDLYAIDLSSGERELVLENPGFAGWVTDHDLAPRFGLQQTPDGGSVLMKPDGAGGWSALLSVPPDDSLTTFPIGFDASGRHLRLLDSRGRDTAALVSLDVESGETQVLAASEAADIADVLIHPETYEPVAYASNRLRREWVALDPAFAGDLEALREQLPGDLQILSATEDAGRFVVYADAAEAPGVYHLFDRSTQTAQEMFTTRPGLAGAPLQPMRPVVIPARDGLELVSYLTLPPGAAAEGEERPAAPPPMVLNVHGGPWARDSYGFDSWHQWLANRGYAVLSVNYRGSSGFGKHFLNAANGEFAGKMHDDLIDAVAWAVEHGFADPDRVAIAGGSYGGYATLVGLTFTPTTFACGVDIVGPSNLVTLIESFPDYWTPYLEATWYKRVGDPRTETGRADLLARSPLTRVDAIERPLLIGQGANDPRVTKQESDQITAAMAAKDLAVTYANFPDEGHGFARPENRLAFYAVMEGFLAACLGGRAEPIGAAFTGSSIEILHGAEHVEGLSAAIAEHGRAGEDG
ncbi:MAG: S9 family peptidase [Caulobacterales bacterium]|nr:S9 family peptidase [Caulobacterales bacterium]